MARMSRYPASAALTRSIVQANDRESSRRGAARLTRRKQPFRSEPSEGPDGSIFLQILEIANMRNCASVRWFSSPNMSDCAKLMFVLRDSLGHAKLGEPSCGNR